MANFCFALTGCIGSGKSTVANLLVEAGFTMISADQINHRLLKCQSTIDWISKNISEEIVVSNEINRKKLGELVFSNIKIKKTLESYLHPLIYQEFQKLLNQAEFPVGYDIPLLFESKRNYPEINYKVLVYANRSTCIERIISRNNLTKEQAEIRIDNQMSIEDKIPLSDYIIDNSADLDALKINVKKFINHYLANCS